MKKVFAPLMQEWESFSPAPFEFLLDASTVVSLAVLPAFTAQHTNVRIFHTPMYGMFGKERSGVIVNISTRWHSKKLGAPRARRRNSSATVLQTQPFAI